MGDVLVYIEESAIDEGRAARLLGWARPLATASGGSLVALVASADGVTADRLPAADIVLHAQHPALSPYLPEAHQAVLGAAIAARTPDAVVLENTTSGWDLAAASAIGAGLPFVGSCEEVSISAATARTTSGVYAGQLAASTETPLPAVFGVTSTALHDEATPAGRGELETLPAGVFVSAWVLTGLLLAVVVLVSKRRDQALRRGTANDTGRRCWRVQAK